jgi:hypothetical protein
MGGKEKKPADLMESLNNQYTEIKGVNAIWFQSHFLISNSEYATDSLEARG